MTENGMPFNIRLEALADRYQLDDQAVERLRLFGGMLAHDPLAPTTVRELPRVRDDHLADSLVALELPEVRNAASMADLGAGAGVPGLPLAVALQDTRVTLLDGSARKCDFMRRAVEEMGLENVTVLHARAETWEAGVGACDLVTARAIAPLDVVEEYAAPLLCRGGALVAWRGQRDPQVESDALRAAQILGLQGSEPLLVRPYPAAVNRYLHVYLKVEETPSKFPRRDGVARKRPLGKA